jgi:hypothetical protein
MPDVWLLPGAVTPEKEASLAVMVVSADVRAAVYSALETGLKLVLLANCVMAEDVPEATLFKEVKKVLVDGEEFFGNDPTIATKNIRADNISTVQVFDKKSEQATLTGIDDGEKNKTINFA